MDIHREKNIVRPYFQNIESVLREHMESAENELLVAVAWFTNKDLFNLLLRALERGVKVKLITLYDRINVDGGLDFQLFIDAGGEFYLSSSNDSIMHNKYCVVDGEIVLTGSYNYTYFAEYVNSENIVCVSSEEVANEYRKYFDALIDSADRVENYYDYKSRHAECRDIFSADRLNSADQCGENTHKRSYVIKSPVCEKQGEDYSIEKITYNDGELVLGFNAKLGCGSFIYSQETAKVWKLESISGTEVYPAYKITDVKIDGCVVVDVTKPKCYYDFGHDVNDADSTSESQCIHTPKEYSLSCDIHFRINDLKSTTYNLYEGDAGDRSKSRYWHVLGINLGLNQEDVA